ncbi:MAG: hypothetical protein ACLVJO_13965 [[Clostridium] scindens]
MELLDDFLTASNLAGIAFGNEFTGAVRHVYPLKRRLPVTHGRPIISSWWPCSRLSAVESDGKIRQLNHFRRPAWPR